MLKPALKSTGYTAGKSDSEGDDFGMHRDIPT